MNRLITARAWLVHFYTALGTVFGLLALIAIDEGRAFEAFILLSLTVLIDGTDGALARAWNVVRWTPRFDGRKLDDITDYLTYVFIPAFFAYRFDLVTGAWLWVLFAVLLASAFGFCQDWAKTDDGFFTGFPSYWNVVVFYLYLLQWPVEVNALVLLGLAVLVFVPIKYVYPTKTKFWMPLTLGGAALWAVACLALMFTFGNPPAWLLYGSLLYPAYYTALSFYLHFRPRPQGA